jgi:UBX domain-containing protein 1
VAGGVVRPMALASVASANGVGLVNRAGTPPLALHKMMRTASSSSFPYSSSGSGGRRVATLGDLGGASGGPAPSGGHGFGPMGGDDDDDEDDEHEHPPQQEGESWYAGGERSGISVQNPDSAPPNVPGGNVVQNLLRRAAEAGPPPSETAAATTARRWGGGNTLGGDEMESMAMPDPDAPPQGQDGQETAIRRLTFWRDGFTVEDGELMRYDDPQNAQILAEINTGRAPPSILNVLPGQPVELRVARRLHEDYVAPPPDSKPFGGSGNRLGGVVPDIAGVGTSSATASSSVPGGLNDDEPPARVAAGGGTRFEVDSSQPVTSIQIRLADGTRLVSRMNLTHSVGDIRQFINACVSTSVIHARVSS